MPAPLVGVLALQGDFEAHGRMLEGLGADVREVRVPTDLHGLDALVLPGGESTTMMLGIAREDLAGPLREFAASGKPVLGTCAGMIVLDREHLGAIDLTAQRNAFGRQLSSFECDLDFDGASLHAVFIRAPWISEAGAAVDLLAEIEGHPVAARAGNILVAAFHPELAGETRLHEWLLANVQVAR